MVEPRKGEVTRQVILRTALGQARKLGLEGLTIGTLAAQLERSKSGVFAHFGSREDLQLAVLEEGARQFVDEVFVPALKEKRGLPRLRALFKFWLKRASNSVSGGCLFVIVAAEFGSAVGPVKDKIADLQERWRKELAKACALACESEGVKGVDSEQMAFELFAIILGVHHDAHLFGHADALARGEAAFERLVRSQFSKH